MQTEQTAKRRYATVACKGEDGQTVYMIWDSQFRRFVQDVYEDRTVAQRIIRTWNKESR